VANLLSAPEALSNAAWTKNRVTITDDAASAPNGAVTADKLVETATTGTHFIQQTVARGSDTTFTLSAFFPPGAGRTRAVLEIDNAGGPDGGWATFDLASQTAVGTQDSSWGYYGTMTLTRRVAQLFFDGSVRCEITLTGASGTNLVAQVYADGGSGSAEMVASYAGDTSKGLYPWGIVLEPTSVASDYPGTTRNVTGAQTLAALSQSSSITTASGANVTGAQTLAALTQSSAVKAIDAVTGAQTLAALGKSSTVGVTDAVTGSQTLPALTQSGSITTTITANVTGSQTLVALTQSGTVAVRDTVTGAQTLAALTRSSAVSAPVAVTGAQTLPALSQISGFGSAQPITVTGAQTLPPLQQCMETYFYPWGSMGAAHTTWTRARRPQDGNICH
jgi:hypothetical protein